MKASRNGFLGVTLVAVVIGMLGLAYASVPLYSLFCRATGYGGTTQRAEANRTKMLDREVVVRFDSNVVGLPWLFQPEQPQVHVKLGETVTVKFVAENRSTKATIGSATFNVQPDSAGSYFNKIECFCFTEQKLAPGERAELPVQFFVSPDLAKDRQMNTVRTITLSYTFFPAPERGQPVAQSAQDETRKKL